MNPKITIVTPATRVVELHELERGEFFTTTQSNGRVYQACNYARRDGDRRDVLIMRDQRVEHWMSNNRVIPVELVEATFEVKP